MFAFMVIKKWWFILRYFLFWMLLFAAYRLLFIILNYDKFSNESFFFIISSFYWSLWLDASAACYILALPVVFLSLGYLFQNSKFLKAINVFSIIMIYVYGFIAIGEDGIYREWGTKLNFQALSHFVHFNEVIRTISTPLIIAFFGGCLLFGSLFTWLYWKIIRLEDLYTELKYPLVRYLLGLLILVVNSFAVFTGIRGGWAPIPITQSVSYYSHNPVLNDASVNAAWNLVSNFAENFFNFDKNPFNAMPLEQADRIVREMYTTQEDDTPEILSTTTPNICFIILESWSANVVGSCGGIKDITPFFDSLTTKGVLFDNMITSALSSEQGITAVLSGRPHTYRLFYTHQANKTKNMGCISKSFHEKGYSTGFYFGGQLSYGNLKGYLYNQAFDVIKEEKDFDGGLSRARLGIHDGIMLQQYAQALNIVQQPFMYSLFTLSSHMPYDIPVPHEFDHLGAEGSYASSVHYTDASLREFFKTASKMPWYKNTLFIMVADHSHNTPNFSYMQSAEFNHIPCLLFGDVIKQQYKGLVIKRKVMQADIAATIVHQCKLNTSGFPWSRNILNSYTPEWAFYPLQQGGGYADGKNWVAFDTFKNSYFLSNTSDSTEIKKLRARGEALQQVLFDEFLKF